MKSAKDKKNKDVKDVKDVKDLKDAKDIKGAKDVKDAKNAESSKTIKKEEPEKKIKSKGSKRQKPFWITRAIAEEYGREEILRTTLCEAIIYGIFVIIVTIYAFGSHKPSRYYLTKALRQQFVERHFATLNEAEITFDEIRTAADFWAYLDNHLVGSLYWESTYAESSNKAADQKAMNILYENKVLGVPRMRQVRVRSDSCIVHEYFRGLFLSCYDQYSPSAEDTSEIGKGLGYAFKYYDESKTKSLSYWGKVSTYGGGGYYMEFSHRPANELKKTINILKNNLWITRATRAVFVDFSIYNANINMFAICKLVFEFPTTGGVIPTADFRSVSLLRFNDSYDWLFVICEYGIYIFIIIFIIEEVREIIYFKLRYFIQFWSYVDIAIIVCTIMVAVISFRRGTSVTDAIENIKSNPKRYGNLEYFGKLQTLQNDIFAIDLFFIYVKIFKYLNFNKSMGQLNNTLRKCSSDILCFSVMFFIIFFAFAELGYLIFGSQVENFSSFGIAMFTLLRTILGDFDYHEIEAANRILAPIYFLSYIFLVFFVLLNMFLAIINDTYADVKTEISIAPDEMQMTDYIQSGLGGCLAKLGCGKAAKSDTKRELNVTIREIREALRRCQFSDIEIEMFFARYNIDPLAEIGKHDIERLLDELEEILGSDAKKDMQGYVHINDFVAQQERLEDIDHTISLLVSQVKNLLLKLEKMDNVRKTRN